MSERATLSLELRLALEQAIHQAAERRHEYLLLEHLLLGLLIDEDTRDLLRACGADPDHLRRDLDD